MNWGIVKRGSSWSRKLAASKAGQVYILSVLSALQFSYSAGWLYYRALKGLMSISLGKLYLYNTNPWPLLEKKKRQKFLSVHGRHYPHKLLLPMHVFPLRKQFHKVFSRYSQASRALLDLARFGGCCFGLLHLSGVHKFTYRKYATIIFMHNYSHYL